MVAKKKAKKATTTKKQKKPAKKKTAAGRNRRITYRCSGFCTATPPQLHVDPGDTVVMKAVGTGVKVTFGARSPFSRKTFNIPAGGTDSARVVKPSGAFAYRLECAHCPTASLPPRIIID